MSALSDVIGSAKDGVSTGLGSLSGAVTNFAGGQIDSAISNLTNAAEDAIAGFGARGKAALGNGFGGINARSDAMQNWCWYAVLPTLGGTQIPWYYITAANAPYRTIQTESIQRNGRAVYFPESYSVENLSLTFFLDSANKSYEYLKTWQGLVLGTADPTKASNQGKWGLPADYKKTIQLMVLSVNKKRLLNIKYLNCFPTSFSALPLASGSSDLLSLDMTFVAEDVQITVNNDKGLLANLKDNITGQIIGGASSALSGAVSGFANSL